MVSAGRLLRSVTARFHATCGWLSFRLGLRGQARKHFERVLHLRGCDFSAYVHLGRIAYDAGDYAGWRREFEHARRADPVRFSRLRHPFELFEPRLAGTTFDDASERATWRSLRSFGRAVTGQQMNVGGKRAPQPFDEPGMPSDDPKTDGRLQARGETGPGRGFEPLPAEPTGFSIDRDSDLANDDCRSSTERRRFDRLGPIARDEFAAIDLDALARQLSGD